MPHSIITTEAHAIRTMASGGSLLYGLLNHRSGRANPKWIRVVSRGCWVLNTCRLGRRLWLWLGSIGSALLLLFRRGRLLLHGLLGSARHGTRWRSGTLGLQQLAPALSVAYGH